MPQVLVSVPDKRIVLNDLLIDFKGREFPEVKDGLTLLRWDGEPDDGKGYMQFSDDYMMELGPVLYEEEVLPWIKAWGDMKDVMEAEIDAAMTESAQQLRSEKARYERLRTKRDDKLKTYDKKTAQIQRELRIQGLKTEHDANKLASLKHLQELWDEYADALCKLPELEGAPWDGGDDSTGPNIVPWPKEPPATITEL